MIETVAPEIVLDLSPERRMELFGPASRPPVDTKRAGVRYEVVHAFTSGYRSETKEDNGGPLLTRPVQVEE